MRRLVEEVGISQAATRCRHRRKLSALSPDLLGADCGSTLRESQFVTLDGSAWEQMDRTRQIGVLQAMIERIGYDGRTQQISIRFHPTPVAPEEMRV